MRGFGRHMAGWIGKINRLSTWIGGGVCGAAGILVRLWGGSPIFVINYLGARPFLPPLWLLGLFWIGWFFAVGAASGYLIGAGSRNPFVEAAVFRGGMCLVGAVTGLLVWYLLLFSLFHPWLSCFALIVSLACGILCCLSWRRVSVGACLIAGGFAVWNLIILFWQLMVILYN